MRCTKRWVLCSLAAGLLTLTAAAQPAADVTLKTATYAELCQMIRAHKGKVVVVDFWANY
jgi:hypothetical protein